VLLLPDANLAKATAFAETLQAEIARLRMRQLGAEPPPVTASLGVAAMQEHGHDLEGAGEIADKGAMR
jgi:GGDEF domain-containing protein